jgi:hypothetical protein
MDHCCSNIDVALLVVFISFFQLDVVTVMVAHTSAGSM